MTRNPRPLLVRTVSVAMQRLVDGDLVGSLRLTRLVPLAYGKTGKVGGK